MSAQSNSQQIEMLLTARKSAPTAGIKAALTLRIRKLGGTVPGTRKIGATDSFLKSLTESK